MSKKIHVRPGKSQSKVGFAVGIIFCLIGLFIAIPTFGIFGIFWTAIAGWITFVNYRNGFTNKQIDSHVIEVDDRGDNVTVTSDIGYRSFAYEQEEAFNGSKSKGEYVENRLRKLQSLYDQALITKDEYEQKKAEILKEL